MNLIRLVLVLIAALPSTQDGGRPIPNEAAVKAAEKLVREIFKDDYTRKAPADQAALGRKLLQQAKETKEDPPALYVLLREAHDRSTQGGDVRGSMDALDLLSTSFQVDRLAMKLAAAGTLSRFAKTPDDFKASAKILLDLAEEAIKAEDFDAAEHALEAAIPVGKNAKDLPFVVRAESKRRELKELRIASDQLKLASEKLAASPDDPSANEAMGRHECFRRENWAAGLPKLAKAGDATLKDLATRDLAAASDAPSRQALADAWWDRAGKESGFTKTSMRGRAAYWYRQVLPSLSGLTRAKVEGRLSEVPAVGPTPTSDGLVAWWKFDEGGGITAADASGGGHAGILIGGPTWGAGKFGGALEFDGVDDWVKMPDAPALRALQKSSYTLSAWFRPGSLPPGTGAANDANYAIVMKTGNHTGLMFTSGGTLGLQHWIVGDKSTPAFSARTLTPAAWHHVTGVLDIPAGLVKVYVNGQLDGSTSFAAGTPNRDYGHETWKVGIANPNAPNWSWPARAAIDEVRLYSRALTDEEIRVLAREP